jgi:signal transduction histidine kinase/CheY-like chemotaxis protein
MIPREQAPWDGVEGEAARTMAAVDWSSTPLGPVATWSQALRTSVGILLHSRHPMFLWWGPELIQLYNDAYIPSFGKGKHPKAMGQAGRDCWQEIWPIIWPQIDDVMTRKRSSWHEDQLVPIWRNGHIEDVYWTYGYSPVCEADGSVGGTLVVCTETTARVLSERRLRNARDLGLAVLAARDVPELVAEASKALAAASEDIEGALVCHADGDVAMRIASSARLPEDVVARIDLSAMLRRLGDEDELHLDVQEARLAGLGALGRPVFLATSRKGGALEAVFVFGLKEALPFDAAYRDHLLDLASQIGRARTRIELTFARRAIEQERTNLLMQAPVATAVLKGPDHVFELANPLYCLVVKREREQLIGKAYREVFPELLGTEAPHVLDRVFATGQPFVTEEMLLPLRRHEGAPSEDAWFKFTLEPMKDAGGKVYGMMAVAVDITAQVAARRLMEEAHAEREQLVVQLQEASRSKDEFLAMLGHEMRNPLSPILTALHLMRLRGGNAIEREAEIIERQVSHMVRLVDDLLDVSRITGGKVSLKKERVELQTVLARAIEQASPLLERKGHALHIEVPAIGLTIDADPVRLAQVFANVLNNAAKYTDEGGHIALSATRAGAEVCVRVRDDGRGISAETLPRIFELFAQERQEVDRSQGGLGLGLAIARSLVELHGGSIEANSAGVGRGSEFHIRLPWAEPRSAPIPVARVRRARPAPASARVLVVDDNRDAAHMLADLVRTFGYEARVAYDGPSALRLAAEVAPDIALLDIGLPVMDGYELACQLKERHRDRAIIFVAVTGYGQAEDRRRAEALGFSRHLVKPLDVELLERTLRELTGPVPARRLASNE